MSLWRVAHFWSQPQVDVRGTITFGTSAQGLFENQGKKCFFSVSPASMHGSAQDLTCNFFVCFFRTWTLCLKRSPNRSTVRAARASPSAPSLRAACWSCAPNTGG